MHSQLQNFQSVEAPLGSHMDGCGKDAKCKVCCKYTSFRNLFCVRCDTRCFSGLCITLSRDWRDCILVIDIIIV